VGYEKRLKVLGLTTLETRMLGGDLTEVFKIVNIVVNRRGDLPTTKRKLVVINLRVSTKS